MVSGGLSTRSVLFFLAFFAVGFGGLSAFLLHKRARAHTGGGGAAAFLRVGRAPGGARAAALAHWGRTFGCPALHDGVDMSSPAASAASSATLHAVRALDKRAELGDFLQTLRKGGEGVEIGVQAGVFSEELLTRWPNCSILHLVDPWRQQAAGYIDVANVDDRAQERLFDDTVTRLARFKGRFRVHRDFSYEAVRKFEDASLDFIYVDAVHDFEGALRDFCDWWPKLAPGGVFAGCVVAPTRARALHAAPPPAPTHLYACPPTTFATHAAPPGTITSTGSSRRVCLGCGPR